MRFSGNIFNLFYKLFYDVTIKLRACIVVSKPIMCVSLKRDLSFSCRGIRLPTNWLYLLYFDFFP